MFNMFKQWCSIVFWYVYQRVNLIFLWGPTLYPFRSAGGSPPGHLCTSCRCSTRVGQASWSTMATGDDGIYRQLSYIHIEYKLYYIILYYMFSGWWFGTWISLFLYIGNNHPNWLIFFRGVGIPPTSINWQLEYQSKTFKPYRNNAECLLIANNIGMPPLCEGRRPPTYVYKYIYIPISIYHMYMRAHTHIIYIHVICICWQIHIYICICM